METNGKTERDAPLLMVSHGSHDLVFEYNKQSLYSISENQCHSIDTPFLNDMAIVGSNYGWLILSGRHEPDCCIWNPLSGDIIELPELRSPTIFWKCILSKAPTEPTCHILFLSFNNVRLAFCQIGDDEFAEMILVENKDVLSLESMTSLNGSIYAFVGWNPYKLVTIHFVGKTIEFHPILKLGESWHIDLPLPTTIDCYLVESSYDGELMLVCRKLGRCCDFKVFRIDINKMEHMELVDIGERTIFVSNFGRAFCCTPTTSDRFKPNTIYYTAGNSEGRYVYAYHLSNRGISRLLACPAAERKMSISSWIEPTLGEAFEGMITYL